LNKQRAETTSAGASGENQHEKEKKKRTMGGNARKITRLPRTPNKNKLTNPSILDQKQEKVKANPKTPGDVVLGLSG